MAIIQAHHGIHCSDIEATKRVLRTLGFTAFQPGAPEPLVFRNTADDYIDRVTSSVLGDQYHTHYVENPDIPQQIDLIQISAEALTPRIWDRPVQGDLVMTISVQGPKAAKAAMQAADPYCVYGPSIEVPEERGICFRWRDGQHTILTRDAEPFAIVHDNSRDLPCMRLFFEEVLDVRVHPLPARHDGADRFRLDAAIGGPFYIEVRSDTPRTDFRAWGKHYPAANHFRLLHRDVARIERIIQDFGRGGFVIPPANGFVFIHGPVSETIEMFDVAVTRVEMA
ncbi:MAG: hypothetical protein FJ194_14375 [Gammaproteobacteria bacterium]|nr:hypothetical protein [Gammaproteobacteria bacterium]